MFTSSIEEAHRWFHTGASLFLLSSDQQLILDGVKTQRAGFDSSAPG